MRIDERVEEAVREAYRSVIAKDGVRLVSAFRGLTEEQALTAIRYGLFVIGFVVKDAFRQGVDQGQLHQLASKIIASESDWIDLGSPAEIVDILGAASRGELPRVQAAPIDVVGNVFVCGAFLLTSFRLENQRWWNYLDEIWAALEATPDDPGVD